MSIVEIWVDGACSGNPGPGGIGIVLRCNGIERRISRFYSETTNNRMELEAAIVALNTLTRSCKIKIYSDSEYLVKGMTLWIDGWASKNWIVRYGELRNSDLWRELYRLNRIHDITWIHVRGHSDNEFNNICDSLAREAIRNRNGIDIRIS